MRMSVKNHLPANHQRLRLEKSTLTLNFLYYSAVIKQYSRILDNHIVNGDSKPELKETIKSQNKLNGQQKLTGLYNY